MNPPLWTGSARARWAVPLAVLAAAGAVAFAATSAWYVGIPLLFVAAVMLIFRRIEVTIDREELVVRYGAPYTWPQRVARRDIRDASVIDLRPMRWGGWGYRGSLRFFRAAAIVLRGGEALALDLRDKRRLFITVDDAAGALTALEN